MRGRQLFKILTPLLTLLLLFLRLLPRVLAESLFLRVRYWKGYVGLGVRYVFLKSLSARCGANVSVYDSVFVLVPRLLELGDHVSIHPLCYIDAQGGIEIGSDVSIAHNVSILSFEHDFSDVSLPIKDAPCIGQKIVIEDNVWIGAGVRVLGGVRIGKGSIIGAGAVVTKDIPPMSIAVGVPARVIRSRTEST